jgi:hypothetical protein
MDANRDCVGPRLGFYRKSITSLLFFSCVIASSLVTSAAHATLISFDDLTQSTCPPDPETASCDPLYVTNQYADLGVTFSGAALVVALPGDAAVVSPPNYMSDFWGPGIDINFSGLLPTAVSLLVSSYVGNASYIDAYDSSGARIQSVITDGNRGLGIPAPAYSPRQLVTFAGAEIARIHVIDLYERRGFLGVDNLSFARENISVPEPSTLLLIIGGLLASLFARALSPRKFM